MTPARSRVRSPQTLSEADRRIVAAWAANCAERVLGLFEAEARGDGRPREATDGLRAFARGELRVWPARSLAGHAHAAAYAAKAVGLASPDLRDAIADEIRWQIGLLSPAAQAALRRLPPVGTSRAGPIGPGLLASGQLGLIVAELQARLADASAPQSERGFEPSDRAAGG